MILNVLLLRSNLFFYFNYFNYFSKILLNIKNNIYEILILKKKDIINIKNN